MSILSSVVAFLFVLNPKPGKDAFMIILIGYSLAVCYVDALAEGITSIVTKLNERIAILESNGMGEKSDDSMKALGLFTAFRGILQALMTFVGGYIVEITRGSHLLVSGIILGTYPILFCVQTIFLFKEERVNFCQIFIFFCVFS